VKKKFKYLIVSFIVISSFTVWFVPFTNFKYNSGDQYQYCRYRLAVYECWRIESEGEGYDSSDSDVYFGALILEKKIGGPLEYFGIKKIKQEN